MVLPAPPDNAFDGLDLSRSEDRIIALKRLTAVMARGEDRMLQASKTAALEFPPSAEQLVMLWMGLLCTSAAVRALAKMMIVTEQAD